MNTQTKAALLLVAANRVLGDVEGHEFHGNQWKSTPTQRPDGAQVIKTPVAKSIAERRGIKIGSQVSYHYRAPGQDVGSRSTGHVVGFVKNPSHIRDSVQDVVIRTKDSYVFVAEKNVRGALRTASASTDNNHLHQVADAHYRQMMLIISAAFMRGKKAYKSGGADAATRAVREGLLESLPSVLLKIAVDGANATLKKVPQKRAAEHRALAPKVSTRFDSKDPNAIKWAKDHAAELAKDISETTRDRIKEAVAGRLAGEDSLDDILDAVGDESRADMIARTETMWAANEGQQQGWDQAVEEGLLPADATVEWIATSDACPICEDLDGKTRPIDGVYDDPEGEDGPPQHPNCRCTEGISAS